MSLLPEASIVMSSWEDAERDEPPAMSAFTPDTPTFTVTVALLET